MYLLLEQGAEIRQKPQIRESRSDVFVPLAAAPGHCHTGQMCLQRTADLKDTARSRSNGTVGAIAAGSGVGSATMACCSAHCQRVECGRCNTIVTKWQTETGSTRGREIKRHEKMLYRACDMQRSDGAIQKDSADSTPVKMMPLKWAPAPPRRSYRVQPVGMWILRERTTQPQVQARHTMNLDVM